MGSLVQDFRYSVRMLWRNPAFAVAVIGALALGIGVNTAIFSVINTVLLKPLPYPDPDRLLVFVNTSPQGSGPGASPTKFNVWRQQTGAFQDVAAYRFQSVNLTGTNDPEQIAAGQVSADFFRLFGAPVIAGRTFTVDEDRPNGGHVVVLSEGYWKRRFAGDATVVGRTLSLNGESYLVLGILGSFDTEAIQGAGQPDVWLPFQIDPNSAMQGHFFMAAGRLKPGVTAASANEQLQTAAKDFRQKYPDALPPEAGFSSWTLEDVVVGNVRSSLLVLMGAVIFVLLIACANVANLLMVHATARKREIAIRAAIGAGRGRIIRQLLTESVTLAMIGGAFGLAIGVAGIRALLAVNPGNIPRIGVNGSGVSVDWRVLAFTATVSLVTGLIFGLLPALRASRADLSTTLKESGGQTGGSIRHNKTRALLVISEMGLALVLLVGAALFIRTFVALRAVKPGFDARQVVTMSMSLTGARFQKTAAVAEVIRNGEDRLKTLPGVEAAGATCCVPLQGGLGLPFVIEGRPLANGPFHGGGGFNLISSAYFSAFKIPVVRGRAFTDQDTGAAPKVAIINQAMARQYWPTGDPLTDRITIAKGLPELGDFTRQIVGVVGDVRDGGLNREPRPAMYIPWAQVPDVHNVNLVGIAPLTWIVRTRAESAALSSAIQAELRQASGGLPVARPRTMDDIVARSTARSDFNMLLLTIFAGAALLLAAIGIYGLMSYSVQQRTREIGIRVALGADSPHVRNMVVRQGMIVALAGVAIGLASAFGLTRIIASFLYGVTAHDPVVFVAVPLLLSAVALIGVWFPARRAARVDPVVALRAE
ncbi:MAG TPA: ABC transporter permease [Vicinamibacterales bacterium]|nr:ABC transporter permease [Vicinamibacterales bacterium]